jgi:hypothetical protein
VRGRRQTEKGRWKRTEGRKEEKRGKGKSNAKVLLIQIRVFLM